MAAQEHAIKTNAIKAKIDKAQAESKCRLCGKRDETVRHRVCECTMLAQREYKRNYDCVVKKIYWKVCRNIGFDENEKWYKHKPEKVVEMIPGRYYEVLQYKLIMALMQEDLIL